MGLQHETITVRMAAVGAALRGELNPDVRLALAMGLLRDVCMSCGEEQPGDVYDYEDEHKCSPKWLEGC